MSQTGSGPPPGMYHALGDPPGTHRYWDGQRWVGGPQLISWSPAYAMADRDYLPELGRRLANPWRRVAARLIDTILMGAVAFALFVAFYDFDFGATDSFTIEWGPSVIGLALGAVYAVVMVSLFGGTVGKLIMGVRVIRIDGRQPPGWAAASRRWLPESVGSIPIIGGLIGLVVLIVSLVWLFQDPRRRTVYDRFAGTYVVAVR